jgi:L-lactate dehydrogenase complex protein LldE
LKIALFITCYNDTLFPETGKAVVRVLERLGHTVEFPTGQTCCGQMHWNTGYQDDALPLLPRFVQQFRHAEAIVVPSSSCVAMMREHYPMMAARLEREGKHADLTAEVASLLGRVYEFSELLTRKLGVVDVGAYFPHRVTCHASCHGLRALGLGDGPLSLLRSVRGIDLVELENSEQCCGFGGTFAIKNAEVSSAMLSDKVVAVLNTRAEVCTATDNSCLMHINGALHRQRTGVETMHLAEILAASEEDASESEPFFPGCAR